MNQEFLYRLDKLEDIIEDKLNEAYNLAHEAYHMSAENSHIIDNIFNRFEIVDMKEMKNANDR